VIAEVGWCGCCTDLVCQNGQLVVDPVVAEVVSGSGPK